MIKLISLMKRKDGMSIEEFTHWAFDQHSAIGRRMPGIKRYHISVLRPGQPEVDFDGAFEMWFDDETALQAALDSPTGTEAREDAMAHASKRVHLRTEERQFV